MSLSDGHDYLDSETAPDTDREGESRYAPGPDHTYAKVLSFLRPRSEIRPAKYVPEPLLDEGSFPLFCPPGEIASPENGVVEDVLATECDAADDAAEDVARAEIAAATACPCDDEEPVPPDWDAARFKASNVATSLVKKRGPITGKDISGLADLYMSSLTLTVQRVNDIASNPSVPDKLLKAQRTHADMALQAVIALRQLAWRMRDGGAP